MAKLHIEKLKRSPHSSVTEAGNTPPTDLNGEAETPSAESSPDLENMDSIFFAGGEHFDDDQDQLVDVSSPASVSEEDEELEHLGKRENLDDEEFSGGESKLEDKGSSNGDYGTKGDSHILKDLHSNEDNLTNGDSHETEDSQIEENSFESEYQEGDSHKTDDSFSKLGDLHGNEEFPLKGDSPVAEISQREDSSVTEDCQLGEISINEDLSSKGDSFSEGDSPTKGDSHPALDCCAKEEFPIQSDTCSSDNSPEKSPLNLDGNFLNNNLESLGYDSSDGKDNLKLTNESTNYVANYDGHEQQDKDVTIDCKNKEGKIGHPHSSDEFRKDLSNSHLAESADTK